MSLREQIMSDIKVAMKAKESARLATLRFISSAFKNKEIALRPNELTDKDCMAVLKKLAKQHKDSIEQYTNAGRADLAEKEQQELAFVEGYLPAQMGSDEVTKIVEEVIAELGATGMKQMGAVMKLVGDKTAGAADNKLVSQLVKEKLQ